MALHAHQQRLLTRQHRNSSSACQVLKPCSSIVGASRFTSVANVLPCQPQLTSAVASVAVSPLRPLQSPGLARDGVIMRAGDSPWAKKDARLVLEDGSVWEGVSFGARGTEIGEVVFNTSMSGYQEIMTDPSYKGQFVVFTCPHIGNVGINLEDNESSTAHLGAIIVRDRSQSVSNYRSRMSLDDYCKQQGVMGISDLDTRALTKTLRSTGCLVGVLTTDATKSNAELVAMAKGWTIVGKDLLSVVSCKQPYEWRQGTNDEWEFNPSGIKSSSSGPPFHVVAYDYGIKHNILRRLASFGCKITVVPADYPAAEVLRMNPDGVFFSNGPGDPSAAPYAVNNAKEIIGKKPTFGICMGHQIMGQAFGGKTFKLKFGHHGGNHPIKFMPTGRVEISAQNHNFAVDPATLPPGVEVSHVNLNDGTCAGMLYKAKKAMTIQYHPEASPGPHDADICFEQFIDMMKAERSAVAV